MNQSDEIIQTPTILLDEEPGEGAVKKKLGLLFWLSTGWIVLIVTLAITAPILPIQKYDVIRKGTRVANGPTPQHWFGTDEIGRDIFSRVIFGARVSLVVGVASIFLGLLIGSTIGILAGYLKGWLGNLFMSTMDVVLAFPPLLLALAIVAFSQSSNQLTVALAIAIPAIPPIARLIRASTLVSSEREFVLAARTIGASNVRILLKEILPNVILPIVSFAIIGVALAIVAESTLSFLGLGVQPPTPTWGRMIVDGKAFIERGAAHIVLFPSLVLFLTVLSLNLAGDRLREYFDVKEGAL